jgi:phage shock protein PspC (stress-responsive transcriptional regulator)
MNNITKCSISGVAFTLDEEAYKTLEAYLDSLRASYGETADGKEIVADIEARIAELILSTQEGDRVVQKPLIDNIIAQMGSARDISEESSEEGSAGETSPKEPRIPRRLYRDTANAKLGGVCAGIGKYFDIDPVWVRLAMFLPLIFTCMGGIPFLGWMSQIFGNLFGIFIICYLIMWFVVPVARTARQKLEMKGERITAESIRETTEAAGNDPDRRARPIVAETVSVFGKVVLILLKLIAGVIVFSLIVLAIVLVVGLLSVIISGPGSICPSQLDNDIWVSIFGITSLLIPVILLIYVLMCLIASRKPGGKPVLGFFLVWLASIAACIGAALNEGHDEGIFSRHDSKEQLMKTDIVIDGDSTTVGRLLHESDDVESVVDADNRTLRLNLKNGDRNIEITVDANTKTLQVREAEPKADSTPEAGIPKTEASKAK